MREAGNARVTPHRRIVSGPSIRSSSEGTNSTGISTPSTTFASTCGRYVCNRRSRRTRRRTRPSPSRPQDQGPHDRAHKTHHDQQLERRTNMDTEAATVSQSCPPPQPDLLGRQTAPAGRLVLRRLCRCRHHVADRGGATVRSPRHSLGPEGPGRRCRQRQRRPRRRPALVRCGRHGLRAGTARPRGNAPRQSSAGT